MRKVLFCFLICESPHFAPFISCESSESTRRSEERGLKVVMKRNLILSQRSRFISEIKISLSFSPCCCLFWNEYLRWSLRERPAAFCWKVILNLLWFKLNMFFMLMGLFSLPRENAGVCKRWDFASRWRRALFIFVFLRCTVLSDSYKQHLNVCWN